MKIHRYLIILLTCIYPCMYGALPEIHHHLNIESGLSSNYVRTITNDSQNFIWIGTDVGLDRYDGKSLTSYAKRFNPQLKGAVQSVIRIDEQTMVVGTSWGAFEFNIANNTTTDIDFKQKALDVRQVFRASDNKIYFATNNGLYRLTNNVDTEKISLTGNAPVSLRSMVEDKNKTLWVAGENGLFKIESATKIQLFLKDTNIKCLLLADEQLFLGTETGLMIFDIDTHTASKNTELSNSSIQCLVINNLSHLFVGTDNNGVKAYEHNNGLLKKTTLYDDALKKIGSKNITTLLCDASQLLWVGTFESGVTLAHLNYQTKFQTYPLIPEIRSLFISPEKEMFIGTRQGGVVRVNSDYQVTRTYGNTPHQHFHSKIITTIYPHPIDKDLLLVGVFNGGISILNKKTGIISDLSPDRFFKKTSVYKISAYNNNELLIASLSGLVRYNLNTNKFNIINTTETVGCNELFTLAADTQNRLWLGTKTGVCYYSLSDNTIIQPEACKPYQFQCSSVLADSRGNIWFCFNKGGVLKLNGDLKDELWLTSAIGMPENAPSSLIEDKDGNIWIGTSKGLFRVNTQNQVLRFGYEDGLTNINFRPELAATDWNGRMWWSNDDGLVSYIKDHNAINTTLPKIALTHLFINGVKLNIDTLAFVNKSSTNTYSIYIKGKRNNNLDIEFAALNYINAHKNQYSYFLENTDNGWSEASNNSTKQLNNLRPGTYHLKVIASNNDGIWSEEPTVVTIVLHPHFYESTWFSLILILTGIILLLLAARKYSSVVRLKIATQLADMKRNQQKTSILKIPEERGSEIKDKLLTQMHNEKLYLNPELRQADVATAIGCSVHELSQVLNTQLLQNFSDFINSYRVNEVKQRMLTDEARKFTLTAIAMQSGFNAKSSFIRAFKKATNMTPSEYFKEIKSESD